jgi:hypothetical protein
MGTVAEPQFGLLVIATDTSCFLTVMLKLAVPPPLAIEADDGET